MVEYTAILSLIALALTGAIGGMTDQVGWKFNDVSKTLSNTGHNQLPTSPYPQQPISPSNPSVQNPLTPDAAKHGTVTFTWKGKEVRDQDGKPGVENAYGGPLAGDYHDEHGMYNPLHDITVTVRDKDGKTLSQGTGYTLRLASDTDPDGSTIDLGTAFITDASTYRIMVVAPGVDFGQASPTLTIRINPAKPGV